MNILRRIGMNELKFNLKPIEEKAKRVKVQTIT